MWGSKQIKRWFDPSFPSAPLLSTALLGLSLLLTTTLLLGLHLALVNPPPSQANRSLPTDLAYSTETTWLLPGLPDLSAAAGYIPHNFSHGEAIFETGAETIHGFRPGKVYPEMYIRDIAWGMETAQYYYPDDYLREPIEAYLRRQYTAHSRSLDGDFGVVAGQGAIGGIITPDGRSNKQTITTDEETSLIHAAYLYYNMTYDADWLRQEINGLPIIERLNLAADWLYANRFDRGLELLWRGHTTDWGDVKFEKGPGYTDYNPAQDHLTASIYDQALAYMALVELARMNAAVGNTSRADAWQSKAEALKRQTNALLWQADKGFYLTHAHITPLDHDFDEAAMISIANALAVYSGLTDFRQNQAIFTNLEWAQQQAGARKPGLSLYPYYPNQWPDLFFEYSGMGYGNYQNGGVWDWWGGVQIKAEFLHGFAEKGQKHLLQVANEWQDHPGNIIEWHSTTDPRHEGSHYYSAAAGTMGSAIIEGFFGVSLDGNGLFLQPRLGLNDGFIRVYQPATDRYAAYRYDWDQEISTLDYGTNAKGPVHFKLLRLRSEYIGQVRLNGNPIDFETETIGHDTYTTFVAPGGQHSLEIVKSSPVSEVVIEAAQPSDKTDDTDGTGETTRQPIQPSATRIARNQAGPRSPAAVSGESAGPQSGTGSTTAADPAEPSANLTTGTAPRPQAADSPAPNPTRQRFFQFIGATLVFLICLQLIVLAALRRIAKLN